MNGFARVCARAAFAVLGLTAVGCDHGRRLALEWPHGKLDCQGTISRVDGSRGQSFVFLARPSVVDISAVIAKGQPDGYDGFDLGAGKRAVRFVWQGDSNTVLYARAARGARLEVLTSGMHLPSDAFPHELHLRVKVDRVGQMTVEGTVDRRGPISAIAPFALLDRPLLVTVYTAGSQGRVLSYRVHETDS